MTPPNSRPTSSHGLAFNPANPFLSPQNSVMVGIKEIPKYLDNCLLALGLHTEARTSFITCAIFLPCLHAECPTDYSWFSRYWLPDLLKHTHIALRFLPQKDYEKTACLNITPTPVSVVRIFMLFQGVKSEDLEVWQEASQKAGTMLPHEWRSIVGLADVQANDGLRVLEWGGMEIEHHIRHYD